MTSYCVKCWTSNDVQGATNGLRFATKEEADAYATNLFMRWTALDRWESTETTDPVTHTWTPGIGLTAVKENTP